MHGLKRIARKVLISSLDSNLGLTGILVRKMSAQSYDFETLKVSSPKENVAHVELNRPDKLNAMNKTFWRECRECFEKLKEDSDYRVVVLSGAGRLFTSGLDLLDMVNVIPTGGPDKDVGRTAFHLGRTLRAWQETFTSIEKCPKPVIVAIHGGCIGGGIDMSSACDIRLCTKDAFFQVKCPKPVVSAIHGACIGAGIDMTSACDIRYCTKDAFFQVKEVDVGLAADVGTLQRLPKIIGNDSLARELCYTARKFYSDEAKEIGYVSRIFPDKASMMEATLELASTIASKSPIAVQGTKISLVYSRDHSVPEGLEHVANWNQAMLQSEDLIKSAEAFMTKKEAKFSKL